MFESFEHYWKSRKPDLDEALRKQIYRLLRHVPTSKSAELHMALDGGKKLRGILLGMITEELGGKWESALPRAVAVELIQAATLIHDDFVDQDRMRRNMPAIWTLEGARKAVLMGDVIFASAIHMMSKIGRDDGLVVSRVIAQISKGALMEPSDPIPFMEQMTSEDWNGDHYNKIIHLKTGVLFGAACELGAISVEADEGIRLRCKRYGSFIGEAYQIADDIKEIKQHLLHGQISSHQMALLAPAVLCFSKEAFTFVPPILEGRSVEIVQPFWECLRSAVDLMEIEIQRLLALAVAEVQEVLREEGIPSLGLKAPEELIAMFNIS
jgi:hypothetical protein